MQLESKNFLNKWCFLTNPLAFSHLRINMAKKERLHCKDRATILNLIAKEKAHTHQDFFPRKREIVKTQQWYQIEIKYQSKASTHGNFFISEERSQRHSKNIELNCQMKVKAHRDDIFSWKKDCKDTATMTNWVAYVKSSARGENLSSEKRDRKGMAIILN